ncbi:MAG TPA: circadian clock KaiB family protein [Vicinamibacterales bacterium]|nr:circadian clock KaiB family protein [Vicinamibacterales bacterium]
MPIPAAGPKVELVPYVSASSASSGRAVANARRILRGFDARDVSLTICDLSADPAAAEDDQIAFTPTLCKRAPEPPMWILGDRTQPEPLRERLEFYGVTPTHGNRKTHDRHPRF